MTSDLDQRYNSSNDRVTLFIDGSNLYHSLRTFHRRANLDYGRFIGKLAGTRRLVRTYYYGARVDGTRQPEEHRRQQKFLYHLEKIPRFELRLSRLVYGVTGVPHEKGVDVKLATDMLLQAVRDNFDVAVLVSGDTDYVEMVQGVKDLGKNVEVVLFDPRGSRELRSVADEVLEIDSTYLADCWLQ